RPRRRSRTRAPQTSQAARSSMRTVSEPHLHGASFRFWTQPGSLGRMPSIAALRHAPWSLSKVQCALRCPLEFHFRYVDRLHEPEVAPETRLGKALHTALEGVLLQAPLPQALAGARKNLMDDDERARYDALSGAVGRFAERIAAFRARRRVRAELV